MKKRIRYSDEPIGPVEIAPDFLPAPEELAHEDDGVKVTLSLSRRSVDFFKAEAQRQNCSYQRMIRRLVDSYAARYGAGQTVVVYDRDRTTARIDRIADEDDDDRIAQLQRAGIVTLPREPLPMEVLRAPLPCGEHLVLDALQQEREEGR